MYGSASQCNKRCVGVKNNTHNVSDICCKKVYINVIQGVWVLKVIPVMLVVFGVMCGKSV